MRALVIRAFQDLFGADPLWVVRAPGRVNLIGDHTDYNDGLVLPMAIDRATWIALRPRNGNVVTLHSLDFKESLALDLMDYRKGAHDWKEYVKGVAWALQGAGLEVSGWEGVVAGDVPMGSGLSSSAAFELALARAFSEAGHWPWRAEQIARSVQKAENEWIGVAVGIMDPLISAVAEAGKAALIDCRSLEIHQVRMPPAVAVVILNTMKTRGLVESAYNERRQQCEEAARYFGAGSLRDVALVDLMGAKEALDGRVFRRARHVLSENQRVLRMAQRLEANDPTAAGELMKQSHRSLREDFEVSSKELDQIVAAAIGQPGCFGARMTGAGFGGCAVSLVREGSVDEFTARVTRAYQQSVGMEPQLLVSSPASGVELERIV